MCTKFGFLFASCLISLTSTRVLSQTGKPSSVELIQAYRESLSYLQSISMKIVVNVDSNESPFFPQTLDFIFRWDSDNNRAEWLGKQLIYDKHGELDTFNSTFIKDIADGNMYVYLAGDRLVEEGDYSRRVILYYNYKERLKDLIENPNNGGPLFGKMYGSNHQSVGDLLGQSSDLHIHDENENIDGVTCFVLEGTSKYGKVTAWIAPEKGYNAMRWVIEKGPHHLFDDTELSAKWSSVESGQVSFNVKELHEIIGEDNAVFVPKLAYLTQTTNFRDGTKNVTQFEYKTSDIQLNPDFEALGAFKIDFPNGIRVFNQDIPSLKFRWEDGKPVALVDKSFLGVLDGQIEQLRSEAKEESTPIADTQMDIQQDTTEPQREVLSETHVFPVLVMVSIGLLIIAVVVWRVPLLKRK